MESARISRLEEGIRACMRQSALQRARAACGGSAGVPTPTVQQAETPLESDLLYKRTLACQAQYIVGPVVVPESVRIQAVLQSTIDASVDPTNPEARFSEYRGPYIPPVCPPIPQEITNAFLPKASTKCPLPNKPWNPATY